jgi:LysR family transcriptional regulator, glycine cleavage system transcriptional activator
MTNSNHLHWDALHSFVYAARLMSFKEAALELSLTPAAISQRIRLLENDLGVPLFLRLNRRLALTPEGRQLWENIGEQVYQIVSAVSDIRSQGGQYTEELTVSVLPSFANKWLSPRLERLHSAYPNLPIRIDSSDFVVDLVRDRRIDFAIRYGCGPYSDLEGVRLRPDGQLRAVCSPKYLANANTIRLLHADRPSLTANGSNSAWDAWLLKSGDIGICDVKGRAFGNVHLAIDAAINGLGLALANDLLVEDDLERGCLVEPFPATISDDLSFWLLWRKGDQERQSTVMLRQWIESEARKMK